MDVQKMAEINFPGSAVTLPAATEAARAVFCAVIVSAIGAHPGRAGWKQRRASRALPEAIRAGKAARAEAEANHQRERAAAAEAYRAELRARLVVVPGDYTLGLDCRTETAQAPKLERRAIAGALRSAGLEVCEFVRVREDGSGVGWNEWPDGRRRSYPAGTFDRVGGDQ
jgi:hypothetical protein